jgi:Tol biopolymer transport system component
MNAEGGNQHQLFVDPASDDDESPTFSPDGSQIVFNRCHIPSGLSFVQCGTFRIEGDGTGLTAVSGFNSNPDVDDLSPVYSPDGKTIAVASFMRGGLLCAIYLMDANGSNIRQLTPAVVEAFGPDWSPDGEKIAFWTHIFYPRNTDSTEIGVINSDRTSLRLLTNPNKPFDFSPSWAPKGNALVFERDFSTTKFSIFLLNPDGSGSVELLTRVGMVSRSAAQRISRRTGERLAAKHHITLIDAGGFFPRWGSAPN